jgi:hypothetical protein
MSCQLKDRQSTHIQREIYGIKLHENAASETDQYKFVNQASVQAG